ncbi:hypothetical protein B6S59_18210 [Pseudomonas sp. A46]|nr:hypothetical protein [Pseudomonas sp. A46]OWJ92893.1 hypothetical protein B6S59_18210 [Pseudomonas sp. A46]
MMDRKYSSFADLCMMTSAGQPWALDMRTRSGNPALLAYLVNSICNLLVESNAISDGFKRVDQGLTVVQGDGAAQPLAPAPLVLLALRYAKSKLIVGGQWRTDAREVVMACCPEVAKAEVGQMIEPEAAAHWAMPLMSDTWLKSAQVDREVAPEAAYAPAR